MMGMAPRSSKMTAVAARAIAKDFTIPCLTRIEKLIKKYPEIDIEPCGELKPNSENEEEENYKSVAIRSAKTRYANAIDRYMGNNNAEQIHEGRATRGSSSKSSVSSSCTNASTSANKVVNATVIKRQPIKKQPVKRQPIKNQQAETNQRQTRRREIVVVVEVDADAKPGTAASKQALRPPKDSIKPGAKRRNGQQKPEGRAVDAVSAEELDTNGMVDETLVCPFEELCQRANIKKTPSNPKDLCREFIILIPDLDLRQAATPPHAADDEKLSTWKARASECYRHSRAIS